MIKDEALKLAVSALKEALTTDDSVARFRAHERALGYIHEALAQTEQEPTCQATGVCVRSGLYVARLGQTQPTGWDNGLSQDYDKKLGAWFSEKPNAKEELRARTFDDYGNKIV
jgi:hypothetical protein